MSSKKEKKDKDKDSKKDKKRKEKKKSKKSKKTSRREGDKSRLDADRQQARNPLSELFSIGMVLFPQLQSDLSGIIMALDSGKQFQLLDNGDKFNSFLLQIFQQLPLKENNQVWTKSERSINLRRVVLESLLQSEVVCQPNTLSMPETLAMRAAHAFAPLLTQFSSLWNDIIPLLDNFIAGEAVDVSGIEIKAIKKGLCVFFQSIGAKEMEEPMTFALPSKSEAGQSQKDDVRKAIRYFAKLFALTKQKALELSINVGVDVAAAFPEKQVSDSSSSPSSSSEDEDDDSMSDDDGPVASAARKGPTMPSKADLALAAKLPHKEARLYEEDSDDDEDVGPAASSVTSSTINDGNAPLGGNMSGLSATSGGESMLLSTAATVGRGTEGEGGGNVKLQREEWMLTPGERMPFGVDPSGDPTMPSNRKFERGKIAKKSAEQIAAQREAEYEHYMNSEEGREAEAVLAEYRKKRGPTLVQIHQEEVAAKRAKNGTTSLSELRQKGFDRERDMSSHRQMGSDQAKKLIDEAKGLDSRFSKSYARK